MLLAVGQCHGKHFAPAFRPPRTALVVQVISREVRFEEMQRFPSLFTLRSTRTSFVDRLPDTLLHVPRTWDQFGSTPNKLGPRACIGTQNKATRTYRLDSETFPWVHDALHQQLHPSLPASSISNKSGSLLFAQK
jgi:hypothetical protein